MIRVGFVEHDVLVVAVSSAASVCLVWLIGGPAASGILRRRAEAEPRAAVEQRRLSGD